MKRCGAVLAGLLLSVVAGEAAAQTFPLDGQWTPLPCGSAVMTDAYRDQSGAVGERDIVGDQSTPAGFRAFDATFLYLRMRLDQDPAPGATPRPFSWGFEFDLEGNVTTYEVLIAVNGGVNQVAIYRNTTTTQPNDPADPADQPAVATYPFSTHGRSIVAAGSMSGGDNDYFLDMAVPWSALSPIGLTPTTVIRVWAASSSTSTALNGDFACHNGTTGGTPTLTGLPTTATTVNPAAAPDGGVPMAGDGGAGDGFSGARAIEGGPGCSLGSGAPWSIYPLLALVLLLGMRRAGLRRRS